ncbi:hypothetical protein QUB19_15665 [Microcoleus sp. B4-C5]
MILVESQVADTAATAGFARSGSGVRAVNDEPSGAAEREETGA